jgi:hypothetical protein
MALFPLLQWQCCHPQAGIVALVAMASLSSSMHRHLCCHCNGIVALVAMALLPLMRRCLHSHHDGDCCPCSALAESIILSVPPAESMILSAPPAHKHALRVSAQACPHAERIILSAGGIESSWHCFPGSNQVIAIINAQASLLLSNWHHCPCCDSVAVINAQVSLQPRHLCHCCDNVVSLVAMALLPLSSWCHFPHHDDIIAIVNVQMSLPLSQWHCHPSCADAIANIARLLLPLLYWRCHPYFADIFALTIYGRCHRCCTGVVAPIELRICAIVLVLLPLSPWHCCSWCAGIISLIVQVSLP